MTGNIAQNRFGRRGSIDKEFELLNQMRVEKQIRLKTIEKNYGDLNRKFAAYDSHNSHQIGGNFDKNPQSTNDLDVK